MGETSPVTGRGKAGARPTTPLCSLLSKLLSPPFLRHAHCSFLLPSCEMPQSTARHTNASLCLPGTEQSICPGVRSSKRWGQATASATDPVTASATEGGWEAQSVIPNSARLSLMALAAQPIISPWFPVSGRGATGLPPLQACCRTEDVGGRLFCMH